MGEMADFALDDVVEAENMRDLYHNGNMSLVDAHDYGFVDSVGAYTGFAGDSYDYVEINTYEDLQSSIERGIENFGSYDSAGISTPIGNWYEEVSYYAMGEDQELRYFQNILLEKYSKKYTEQMVDQIRDSGFNTSLIDTKDELYKYIEFLKENYSKAYEAISFILYKKYGSTLSGSGAVNKEAVKRAARENPTCNVCNTEMTAQNGRYGKFYFCANKCEGQKTVSDAYWQDFKQKAKSLR